MVWGYFPHDRKLKIEPPSIMWQQINPNVDVAEINNSNNSLKKMYLHMKHTYFYSCSPKAR